MYKTVQAASQMEETIDSWCVKAAQTAAQCSETNVGRVGIQDGNLKYFSLFSYKMHSITTQLNDVAIQL